MDTTEIMQSDGSLRCTCGSTQFHAQRSVGRKLAFGVASLLGSTNEVRCLACGRKFTVPRPLTPSQIEWQKRKDAALVPPRPDVS